MLVKGSIKDKYMRQSIEGTSYFIVSNDDVIHKVTRSTFREKQIGGVWWISAGAVNQILKK